jgi:acyl carrier protein
MVNFRAGGAIMHDDKGPSNSKGPATDISRAVQSVLADKLHRPAEDICPDADLEKDLNVDSMSMIQVNIALEEQFEITMPEFVEVDEINVHTVSDLAEFVETRIQKKSVKPEE